MRSKIVTVNGKSITVQEKRIGELETLLNNFVANNDLKNMKPEDLGFDFIYNNLTVIFPKLTEDDIKNAYPSEIEELIQAFIDTNFFGLKKIIPSIMYLIRAGLMQKQ